MQWDWAGPGPGFGRHFGQCWGGRLGPTAQKALVVAGTVSGLGLRRTEAAALVLISKL